MICEDTMGQTGLPVHLPVRKCQQAVKCYDISSLISMDVSDSEHEADRESENIDKWNNPMILRLFIN